MIRVRRQTLAMALALFSGVIFILTSVRILALGPHNGWAKDQLLGATLYNRTVLTANYFDLGFVRRGLAGTITGLLHPDFVTSGVIFHIVSALFLSVALGYLIYRIALAASLGQAGYLAFALAISPQTFLGWSRDLAHTDLLVGGFLAWALIALLQRRTVVAVVVILVGSLAHETVIIYGAPLLLALLRRDHHAGRLDQRKAMLLLALFAFGVLSIFLGQKLFSAPEAEIADYMRRHAPPSPYGANDHASDVAIYMESSGVRGLVTSICWNLDYNPQYYLMGACALGVGGLYAFIFGLTRRLLTFVVVAIVPMLFLIVVANDTGRWLMLSVLNAWLAAAALQIQAPEKVVIGPRHAAVGAAILCVLALAGSTQYFIVNRVASAAILRAGFAAPGPFDGWMAKCDPDWRSVVYGSASTRSKP